MPNAAIYLRSSKDRHDVSISRQREDLKKLASTWFKPTDMMQPVNQDAYYKTLLCYGNLTTSNPSRQGVLHSVTVAA